MGMRQGPREVQEPLAALRVRESSTVQFFIPSDLSPGQPCLHPDIVPFCP